uniref:Fe2OG dioxygenase domain-containing protein n=1 Tax=Chromera velia CCMP2878 TaxID=1169474 RepID=A0A0G4GH81_9ALVE|eukprot:Cvel_4710.t1-p1 / transcript=Cvel_4710.t1 / gene=Cvel_4710 / organism=Chromera_velia_CCMP2878 / gene_product=Uncharacterized PKHD-type hydroxylase At1g22950, putative / transcript_product=Uncharacterized PKHD-type hydroxylase At1g22950, putative / location=Cvel_scaffold209:76147-78782(-) / protein_length=569 / sequence_SO=supercontig / SO=protein_coding / is_pseudo=false
MSSSQLGDLLSVLNDQEEAPDSSVLQDFLFPPFSGEVARAPSPCNIIDKEFYAASPKPQQGSSSSLSTEKAECMGSPLYIACVSNLPIAVAKLIHMGANPMYRHPAPHGDGPLFHCPEQGYEACLKHLLQSPFSKEEAEQMRTKDFKIALGQALPHFEAGGRSPLLLAACNGHAPIVELFLQDTRCQAWAEAPDSFGRAPLQVLADEMASLAVESVKRKELLATALLLCAHLGIDEGEKEVNGMIPGAEEAKTASITRNKILRSRVLKAETARKQELRLKGLSLLEQHYAPRHSFLYDPTEVCAAMFKTDTESSTENESAQSPAEISDGVFAFPLANSAFCKAVWEEIHHYEKFVRDHPDLGLPLHERHDGNLGNLQDCGFLPLLEAVEKGANRAAEKAGRPPCRVYHAFLTRNFVGREENAKFKVHCDRSAVTINLCVHASDDLQGSTVGFFLPKGRRGRAVASPKKDEENDDGSAQIDPPGEEERVLTYAHKVGTAVMHDGSCWHKTDPIERGSRGSLIVWARLGDGVCGERDCGEPMDPSWKFCKACGWLRPVSNGSESALPVVPA